MRFTLLAMVFLNGSVGLGNAQEPTASIFSEARTAARKQQLNKSEQIGFSIIKTAFSDIPAEGGVLIGFHLQLSKLLDHEIVQGIKPIYATEAGDIGTHEFGAFGSKSGKKKDADLLRAVRISAPQGFAVGSITVRHGLYIDGLRLTFHRIKGNALDTADAAITDWIGSNKSGHSEKTIGGNGAPIIGIFGNKDERRVLALGVYQLPVSVVALPRPVPRPREDRAAIANRRPEQDKLAVVPEKKPADEMPIEPASGIEKRDFANEEPKAAPKAQGQDQPVWLPFGIWIFGCLSVIVIISCWLAFGGKLGDRVDPTAAMVKTSFPSTVPPGALSVKPASPSPTVGRLDDSRAGVPSMARTRPPYFHARAVYAFKRNRFYRVYVLPEMLLFLDAGPETNDQCTRGIGAAGAVTGGILGALIGSAIGSVIDSTRGDTGATRKMLLDTADTAELIQLSGEESASFSVVPADLRDARIEPPSLWHTVQHFGKKYVGLLCFHHRDRGDMTLEIPAANDMQTAVAALPFLFGDDLAVNVVLDRHGWQWVGKPS
jgi:hypothetical protein